MASSGAGGVVRPWAVCCSALEWEPAGLDCRPGLQAGAFRGHTFCSSSNPQEGLLDRLSLYLRARIPAVREIHRVHRDGVDIY